MPSARPRSSNMREFRLPDVGEGVAEGEIVQWLVAVGDHVEEDQPIAEVETDKALVEVPSPVNGVVDEIRAEAGEVVPVGEVLVVIDEDRDDTETDASGETTESQSHQESPGESQEPSTSTGSGELTSSSAVDRGADGRVFTAPRVRRLARELDVDLSALAGTGAGGRITEEDVRAAAEGEERQEEAPTSKRQSSGRPEATFDGTPADDSEGTSAAATSVTRDRTLATPATRRLAHELGVDLDRVPMTEERDGEAFVSPEDVRAFAESGPQETESTMTPEEAVGATGESTATEEERIPYRGVRRSIGEQMERSAFTAPHVTHHDEADATRLVEMREALKSHAEERGVKLTYVPFVLKAVVDGLQAFPDMNATLEEDAEEIVRKHYYNIGVATATDAGLMVPVVEAVDEKGLLELASEIDELAGRARDRSIAREEMLGGTFTITNFGAIGGEYATPIINYPEVAILGLGAIRKRPRVVDDEVVPRYTLPLSLSIDHRVVDGAVAARFVNHVIEHLEEPGRLLL